MITIEKEKTAEEALTLFSVTVKLTQGDESGIHVSANVKGHRAEMMAFLDTLDISPEKYRNITAHAAMVMLRDFIQQVVNLSESIKGAEMELMPWSDSNENHC